MELVVVLAVLAIIAVSAIANWPGAVINLDAQARQLAGDIRYVQSLSMTHGPDAGATIYRCRINFQVDRYNIRDRTGAVNPNCVHPNRGAGDILLDTGMTLASANAFIGFDGKGVPYTDAALGTPLAADAVIILSAGADSRQVVVSPETGRVQVQ